MTTRLSGNRTAAAGLLALLWMAGCGGDTSTLLLIAELPHRAVEAQPGETVWAAIPESGGESVTLGTFELESSAGNFASLTDILGNRFEKVPGALIYPLSGFSQTAKLATGSVALADRWDARKVVGRVASSEGDAVQIAFDWNGTTETAAMNVVMPLPAGGDSLVLRWVAYRVSAEGATWYKGLCFAESENNLWISADGGHLEVVERDQVRPLDDLGRSLAVGDTVSAYSSGYGYRSGVIEEILEPDLRFGVKLDSGEIRPYFFENLTQGL